MLIRVTQKNIDEGVKNICALCPIALAIKDLGASYVTVGAIRLYFRLKEEVYSYWIPPKVQSAIEWFDGGGLLTPFKFELPEKI